MQDLIQWPPRGRYILAVSGGADSMVLLDLMAVAAASRDYRLVVAHFDHGLRADSASDQLFVHGAAKRYDLPFEHHEAHLGEGSEATARAARHSWLEQIRQKHSALAVVTAHHQDDLIETSLLNLARGTGRRGLAPMQNSGILRPLLAVTRNQLRDYASSHQIVWREDSTNADNANPRNFLRHKLLPAATAEWRSRYLENVSKLATLNKLIVQNLESLLQPLKSGASAYSIPRHIVRDLSLPELEEALITAAHHLRPGVELDRRVVAEVALFAKTSSPHRRRALREGLEVSVQTEFILLETL
jgi:tRNA(Ile)-lysidine synthetase-like protein